MRCSIRGRPGSSRGTYGEAWAASSTGVARLRQKITQVLIAIDERKVSEPGEIIQRAA
jgi:hypothetical protein